jgi:23S rRNA pseudouridine2605 synthase
VSQENPRGAAPEGVRLQKILARAGVSSRRVGEQLIVAGRVKVNDKVVTELGTRVDPGRDVVTVDGRVVQLEAPVYVVLNKPDEVVCSAEAKVDERGRPTVVSLLRGIDERVYPVGRLDYHTRGVLLLTNDGDLAAKLTHPRNKIPKTYHAKFQGRLTEEEMERLLAGVVLEDGTQTQPLSELTIVKETTTNTWAQLTLTQGLYRQVRRMGDAIGRPVLKLIRVSFAGVTGDGLADGQWRRLREDEVERLRAVVTEKPRRERPRKDRRRRRAGESESGGKGKAKGGSGGAGSGGGRSGGAASGGKRSGGGR